MYSVPSTVLGSEEMKLNYKQSVNIKASQSRPRRS